MDIEQDSTQLNQEQLVADWLISTPGFFDRHPDLLTKIELANSHSGKAISLQEKQMALLRSQNRDLNQRLSEMLRFGTENDRTQSLMIHWLEELLLANDQLTAIESITSGLNRLFDVGQVKIIAPQNISLELNQLLEKETICGDIELAQKWIDAEVLIAQGSFVLTRLSYQDDTLGALLLMSPDSHKFLPNMGLNYIYQLGRLAAAALYRFRKQ
jgi:uncharacterized protein YigA (DUF484 family)